MRIGLTILTILVFISCSTDNECENRFVFSNCNLKIPIVQIDYSNHFDTIRQDIQNQFEDDLCERCSWVEFKIPFQFEGKNGYLKVMADFDYPICENCGVPMRLRYYYWISINRRNELLVNGRILDVDSLKSSIIEYFENVGSPTGYYPEKHSQVNFRLIWDRKTEKASIENILTEINNARLTFVEQTVVKNGLEFCNLTQKELEDLKNKYPLRIEFDLGKIDKMKPDFEKQKRPEEIHIIDEDIEIESEI